MKITRITKINNYRVFRRFVWPSNLLPFAQFNVIYGWNGSGKTTLSSLLAHLQDKSDITEGNVEFEFNESHKVLGSEISASVITVPPVKVFNRDFVANTVEAISSGDVTPIFFIGEENIEQRKKIGALREELERVRTTRSKIAEDERKAEQDLDRFLRDRAKLVKDSLIGSEEHQHYNKRNFAQAANSLSPSKNLIQLSGKDRKVLNSQRLLKSKPGISAIPTIVCDLTAIHREVSRLAGQSIVSQIIEELADNANLGNWVQRGLELHPNSDSDVICAFCKNPFSSERREELERHFNDELKALQRQIDQMVAKIDSRSAELRGLPIPDPARFYENLEEEATTYTDQIKDARDSVIRILDRLKEVLVEKQSSLFSSMPVFDLTSDETNAETLFLDTLKSLNRKIKEHEDATSSLDEKKREACRKLEKDIVVQALPDWHRLTDSLRTAHQDQKTASEKLNEIQQQIDEMERQIIEHRRPAEELTHELKTYLGRDELHFEIKEAGYALTRSGQLAQHLSEGERTAIAFLYFLKSLEDTDFDKKKGVVVIDDPVSSLDANALFSAFSYMKEKTKSCGQLIILTHNFAFFRQVKNWFRHLPSRNKKDVNRQPARFYMLATPVTDRQRTASLAQLDPLLKQFESEYHYLFKKVYEMANEENISNPELGEFYPVPNIARRLLETFLSYKFPDKASSLRGQIEECKFNSESKTRILRFLNTFSHKDGINSPEHDPSILSETKPVLKDVLALIKETDNKHYEGMVRLLNSDENEQ